MADIRETLVHFMKYMGMDLGDEFPQPGREYRFKNFSFRDDRSLSLRHGLYYFWVRADFDLQGEYYDENMLAFSLWNKKESAGLEVKFTFEEEDCNLAVVLPTHPHALFCDPSCHLACVKAMVAPDLVRSKDSRLPNGVSAQRKRCHQ